MCFRYKEKRYGKSTLVVVALVLVALAVAAGVGGVFAVIKMSHWSKYVIVSVAAVAALCLLFLGGSMLVVASGMSGYRQSVRDIGYAKGVDHDRLCDKCGKLLNKEDEFCTHCGAKQTPTGKVVCPLCKSKNDPEAEYCAQCGHKFN